jgi:CRISPR-associated protein Cas2
MSRLYIICFDISDNKRLRKVSIQLENFGERVQYSVFECYLDANDLNTLKQRIDKIIDQEVDHVRYYGLCDKDISKKLIDGRGNLAVDEDYHLV